ncbi:OmpA family protein [Algoriphagus sp. PAP.12]|uniref:OmpA family protein n=1 Tax=Algoriphagus sp. PAP.12 TaxID=2996678 RepID=UPI00227B4F72|nr:OmpA family protein [Algoriphagus sp. PAP.12]
MKKLLIFFLSILLSIPTWAQRADKEGSKDHPLIQRLKQSSIFFYEETSFDLYTIITGASDGSQFSSTLDVEGKMVRIFYTLPTEAGSVYEIFSNYLNAFQNNGAEILFSCKNTSECGRYFWDILRDMDPKIQMPAYYGEELAYIAAKFSKDGMGYYVTVLPGYGLSEIGYEITVVEVKEMEQQINLGAVEKAMNENGKISLYGILFDIGSDVIQESSFAEIELIAQYLQKHPDKNVYVVGHTDNTGSYETNIGLSKRRAQSVKDALKSKFGIASSRMTAAGVGPVAPEALNTMEAGRKKNRRVEIVLNEF